MIKSLDELVTDIEDTCAHTEDVHQHCQIVHAAAACEAGVCMSDKQQQQQQQQPSQLSIGNIMADVSRQLRERFDLHDQCA